MAVFSLVLRLRDPLFGYLASRLRVAPLLNYVKTGSYEPTRYGTIQDRFLNVGQALGSLRNGKP